MSVGGGDAFDLRVSADSFCSLDEDLKFGGTLTLEYQDEVLKPNTAQVAGDVDFKFEFKPEAVTAKLGEPVTGAVGVDVRTGGLLHFRFAHPSEAAVDESVPSERRPRWEILSMDPDRPKVFVLKEGATKFEYQLIAGRCCSSDGDQQEFLLEPGRMEGETFVPYAHVKPVAPVPVTVGRSL